MHGPELQAIETGHGTLQLSIFEDGVPPRFRLTGAEADFVRVETIRESGARQAFAMAKRGGYWESVDEIPEPHGFKVAVTVDHGGHAHSYYTEFAELSMGTARTSTARATSTAITTRRAMTRSMRLLRAAWPSRCVTHTPIGTAADLHTSTSMTTTAAPRTLSPPARTMRPRCTFTSTRRPPGRPCCSSWGRRRWSKASRRSSRPGSTGSRSR